MNVAVREPSPAAVPIGRTSGVSRRRTASSTASTSAPARSILLTKMQGRHAEALQRAHQDPGLRLHPLDGGQDQHGTVQHAEDALDLGDEVGVARGVDDVDVEVAEREPDDRGLDRDAAPALEREAVGAGGAGVDRAGLVDDPGEVQEPFGEGGLTGVDVGEDAQVE